MAQAALEKNTFFRMPSCASELMHYILCTVHCWAVAISD